MTRPDCCGSDLEAEYNTGSDELNVPNLTTRVALNPAQALHVDVGAVLRAFSHIVKPSDDTRSRKSRAGRTSNLLNPASSRYNLP